MGYLLDTNACINILNSPDSSVAQRATTIPASEIFLCSIVCTELYYGAYNSNRREQNLQTLDYFFNEFIVLNFDLPSAKLAGQIRAQLRAKGTPIGSNDVLIGAIALANNLTLITHNTGEFSRIDGLTYEDWE